MASNGSFNTSGYDGRYLNFSWSEKSQSVANNTTTISWTLKGAGGDSTWYMSGNFKVVIDGSTVYSSATRIQLKNGTVVASGTYTFQHNADGKKSFSVSAEAGIYTVAVNCRGSATFTLDTIPRASTPTVSSSSVFMGSAVTINTNRASTAFTHDLAYSFAGSAYVTIRTGVGASYSWATPDLASKIPSATSGTVTIRCITKNGTTTIGTKTITMTLKVPESVVPTISAVSTAEAAAGLAAQFGAFVKGKSKIKVTISASGAKGSTIKSYSTTLDGKTYTGSSWTSQEVGASGSVALVTTVTDSRGRTAKKTTTITVLDYSTPTISALQVYRVNADGVDDQDGVYIAIRYAYAVATVGGKNTAQMVLEYKHTTATEWADLLSGSDLSADTMELPKTATFSTDYQFDIRMTVTDYFGASVVYVSTLPSGAVILDIGADGESLSIGRVAELPGVFHVAWKTRLSGGLDCPVLKAGADFNDCTLPGIYSGDQVGDLGYVNAPDLGGDTFTLEVLPGGDATQITQRVTVSNKTAPKIFERFYYSGSWGDWVCISDFGTKVLWSGANYMTEVQTAVLSEPILAQPHGVVLVFSAYEDGAAKNWAMSTHFVSKSQVASYGGSSHIFSGPSNALFGRFWGKWLYIHNDKIVGHVDNTKSGTGVSGVAYNNMSVVLRHVVGV